MSKIETGGPILFFSEGIQTATLLPDGELAVREPGGDGVTTYPDWHAFLREVGIAESPPEAEKLKALGSLLGEPKTADGKAIQVETPQPVGVSMGTPQPRRRGRPPSKKAVPPITPTALEQLAAEAAATPETSEQAPEPTAEAEGPPAVEREVRRLLARHGLVPVLRAVVGFMDACDRELRRTGLGGSQFADQTRRATSYVNAAAGVLPRDLV